MENKHQLMGVSDLANYAADPRGFVARKGKVTNKKAVQYGNLAHHSAGITGFRAATIKVLLLIALIVAMVWLYKTGTLCSISWLPNEITRIIGMCD